ncbi:MAG: cupin, partial [Candidatus Shapirobacteria bacterium]|nr:cupin [Candidatus Shapirobacteria bacterium]
MSQTIVKPWGEEIILTESNLPYSGKILKVKAGLRLSLQYHDQKTETLTLISGEARIIINKTTQPMVINQGYTILPKDIHRVEAVTDCVIFEVATPEVGTTFRLEDDYHRS